MLGVLVKAIERILGVLFKRLQRQGSEKAVGNSVRKGEKMNGWEEVSEQLEKE